MTQLSLSQRIAAFAKRGQDYLMDARQLAYETLTHTHDHNDWAMLSSFANALNSEGLKAAFIDWAMTFSPSSFYEKGDKWQSHKNKAPDAPGWNLAAAKSKPFDLFQVKAEPKMLSAENMVEKIEGLIKSAEGKLTKANTGREDVVKDGDVPAIRAMIEALRKALPSTGNVTAQDELKDLKADIVAKPIRTHAQRISKEGAQSVMASH